MTINTLKDVTTYSGADITILAYRGASTPAEKFKIDNINRRLRQNEKDLKELESSIAEDKKRTKDEIINTPKELIEEYNVGRDPTVGSMSALAEKNPGAHQRMKSIAEGEDTLHRLKTEEEAVQVLLDEQTRLTNEAIPHLSAFKLGSLHTISYSSFREKYAVRGLGRVQAKRYTRGPRTVAGTMVFNVLQEHELMKLIGILPDKAKSSLHPAALMLDQLEPFDLLLAFANEFGQYSALHLLDVEIASEGQQMSIDDIITHNTMNFYATDMIPMKSLGYAFSSTEDMLKNIGQFITDTTINNVDEFRQYRIDAYQNPFKEDSAQANMLAQSRGLF